MKATLEFNLPEESDDHTTALNAWKYRAALSEVFGVLRSKSKYDETITDEQQDLIDMLRNEFSKILDDLGIEEV